MYKKLKSIIEEYKTIIIYRHSRPDGDALGSQFGLKKAIELNYPDKCVYAVGDTNQRLSFMGNVDEVEDSVYEGALCIVLDTSDSVMISDDRYKKGAFIVKIDHHLPKAPYGDFEIVDTSFESCAGVISDILINLDMKMNNEIATNLFTGIVTDSGRFRFSSTNPRTYRIVSKLAEFDIDTNYIYNKLYITELAIVKLKAQLTLNFKLTRANVAYLKNTAEDIKKYNTDFFTISRGMVGIMSGIEGVNVWVNFTEDVENKCVVAEIRSNGLNINQIACKYGGGGHLNASGASLKDFKEADLMLEDLNKLVEGTYDN